WCRASATLCAGRYPQAEQLAVRAARALGLDIAGVDLLFTSEDTFTICEVNAVPGWRPEMTAVTPAITARIAHALSTRHRETSPPASWAAPRPTDTDHGGGARSYPAAGDH
ncbi:hypothetical protein HCK01_37150, partial [Streptomyces sp. AA8]|nr:hypothetical protein [Streptomyces telluris]